MRNICQYTTCIDQTKFIVSDWPRGTSLQSTLSETDTLGTCSMCPSYRESNKGRKERQGPTLSVRLIEVSCKRE